MDGRRKTTSLARDLARSLKLSQRLTVAQTKATLKSQRVNARRDESANQTRRTTD